MNKLPALTWVSRLCFTFVFIVNIQCAISFILFPEIYLSAYELTGVSGRIALQGLGIAFLMWNCTYPFVIQNPRKHRVLTGVVLVQQMVGLVGETSLRLTLPAGHAALASSIERFIAFDFLGLVLMLTSTLLLWHALKKHPYAEESARHTN
jgi:hypothetical protein